MSDTYQLYLAKNPLTGLFLTRVQSFFDDSKGWIEAKKPTDEEIIGQLHEMEKFRSMWTDDIYKADLWNDYKIKELGKYLENLGIVFTKVNVGVE